MRCRLLALSTFLTLAPAAAWAQGLPADDEIVLPGRHEDPPAAAPERAAPERPARSTRSERRRRGRRPGRVRRHVEETFETTTPIGDEGSGDDREARRLEDEGIEYEVRQEIEWEERRRREEAERLAVEEPLPEPPPRQVEDDEIERALREPPRRDRDRDREPEPERDSRS